MAKNTKSSDDKVKQMILRAFVLKDPQSKNITYSRQQELADMLLKLLYMTIGGQGDLVSAMRGLSGLYIKDPDNQYAYSSRFLNFWDRKVAKGGLSRRIVNRQNNVA